jgi:hypothetical protein
MYERAVLKELLEKESGEQEADSVEALDLPSTHLARPCEYHASGANGNTARVEPDGTAPTRHENYLVERERMRPIEDERWDVTYPGHVDEHLATVLRSVKRDSLDVLGVV